MRRKDRQRSEEFAWAVTDRCGWAVLSCVQPDGTPYSVPLSIAREGGRVYFHCAEEGRKTEALRSNPKVCLSCVGDTHPAQDGFSMEYESAILRQSYQSGIGSYSGLAHRCGIHYRKSTSRSRRKIDWRRDFDEEG